MVSPVESLLKPLKTHLNNNDAIEIICNTPGVISVEKRNGRWDTHNIPELDENWWNNLGNGVAIVTGQRFSSSKPILKGRLPGGHRIFMVTGSNIIDPHNGGTGVMTAIRLNRKSVHTFNEFGIDDDVEKLITNAVHERKNMMVAGSMGSGKTSLTQIICNLIKEARPVSIEDSAELSLKQPQASQILVSSVEGDTQITNKDIVSSLQRSRADRFVIGELAMENVEILMRLLNMGSPGTIFTIHADQASEAIDSIAELLNLSGYSKDETATKRYFERKIDMVIYVKRVGSARVISEILRPIPGEAGEVLWSRG